jgi:hypothetical protein
MDGFSIAWKDARGPVANRRGEEGQGVPGFDPASLSHSVRGRTAQARQQHMA